MSGQNQSNGGPWQAHGQAPPKGFAYEFGTGRLIPIAQAGQPRTGRPVRRAGG